MDNSKMPQVLKNIRYVRITDDSCRICLRETPAGKEMIRSFKDQATVMQETKTYGEIFEYCTGYKANHGPLQICVVCAFSLEKFYQFRLEVDNAEALINQDWEFTAKEIQPEATIDDSMEFLEEPTTLVKEEKKDADPLGAQNEYLDANIVELKVNVADDTEYEQYAVYQDEEEYPDDEEAQMVEERLDEDALTEIAKQATGSITTHMPRKGSKVCDICDKKFSSASHCEQHKKIHYNIKEFECSHCRKWFRTNSQLNSHMAVHKDERQYECEICQKKFKTKKTLRGHEETHSTDRKFFCTYCEKSYTNKTALRVHTLRRHKNVEKPDINLPDDTLRAEF